MLLLLFGKVDRFSRILALIRTRNGGDLALPCSSLGHGGRLVRSLIRFRLFRGNSGGHFSRGIGGSKGYGIGCCLGRGKGRGFDYGHACGFSLGWNRFLGRDSREADGFLNRLLCRFMVGGGSERTFEQGFQFVQGPEMRPFAFGRFIASIECFA